MKILNTLLAAVAVVLLVSGCTKKPLNYVPEDAEFVVYSNMEGVLESKIWDALESNKVFSKEVIKSFEKEFGFDLEDLSGKIVLWGSFKEKGPKPEGMVVCLNEDEAEKIFKKLRSHYNDKDYYKVKKDDVDDCEAFTVSYKGSKDDDDIVLSVVLVNDKELHFAFEDEPEIFEKSNKSKLASALDADAVFACATNGESLYDAFEDIDEDFEADGLEDVGLITFEVFCTKRKITVEANADISEVK